jgi:hypothetical protein
MPSRRIGAIWAAMFKGKEVNRPHCVKRVAAIRNHLSDLGLIAWQDERYWAPDKAGKPGCETRKGVCCKYSLSKQIMEELGLASREEGVLGSRESTAGTDPDIIPFTQETIGNTRQNTTIDLDVCLASIRIPGRRSLFFPDASAGCYSLAEGAGRPFLACSTR